MQDPIAALRENFSAIHEWGLSLLDGRLQMIPFGEWRNGLLKNPEYVDKSLLCGTPGAVFLDDIYRQVVLIDIPPFVDVPWHDHRDTSYYLPTSSSTVRQVPFSGARFKTTHFVLRAPQSAEKCYMFIQGRKHTFEVGQFEVFDVSHTKHFATNQTPEPLTMLYVEFYLGDQPR